MVNVKLKLSFLFLITLFTLSVKSQAPTDSLQIKLDQYKKLLDNGVISEEEYNKMKSELFAPPAASSLQTKTTDSTQIKLDQYKKLYDSGVISEEEYNKMKSQ